jgi:hypothetical protein
MTREKRRPVARKMPAVLLQPLGDRIEALVSREALRLRERVQPSDVFLRRLGRILGADTECVERDDAARASRTDAGVVEHHVAAQTVPRNVDGLAGSEGVQQRLEVGNVIRIPVALRLPGALAVSAEVRRDHIALAHERVDQELNDAATSIQPCSRNSFGAAASPQVSTWESRPRSATRCDR